MSAEQMETMNEIVRRYAEKFSDEHNIAQHYTRPAMAALSKDIAEPLIKALKMTVWPEHHRENGKCVVGMCSRCDIEATMKAFAAAGRPKDADR